MERTDIVIYTQGWDIDQATTDGPPLDQIKGRLFINGQEVPHFLSARILARTNDFLLLSVRMNASTLRFVPCADLSDISTALPDPAIDKPPAPPANPSNRG